MAASDVARLALSLPCRARFSHCTAGVKLPKGTLSAPEVRRALRDLSPTLRPRHSLGASIACTLITSRRAPHQHAQVEAKLQWVKEQSEGAAVTLPSSCPMFSRPAPASLLEGKALLTATAATSTAAVPPV